MHYFESFKRINDIHPWSNSSWKNTKAHRQTFFCNESKYLEYVKFSGNGNYFNAKKNSIRVFFCTLVPQGLALTYRREGGWLFFQEHPLYIPIYTSIVTHYLICPKSLEPLTYSHSPINSPIFIPTEAATLSITHFYFQPPHLCYYLHILSTLLHRTPIQTFC